jgi:hypothetical protein
VAHRTAVRGARRGRDRGTATVVEHLDGDAVGVAAQAHLSPCPRPAVLERVGQRLLDDPVRGQLHPGRERAPQAVHREGDVQAGRADLVDERGDVGEAGLGTQAVRVGLGLEDTE